MMDRRYRAMRIYWAATETWPRRYEHERLRFEEGLRDFLGPTTGIEWPQHWPLVEHLFGSADRFVEAVEQYEGRLPADFVADALR